MGPILLANKYLLLKRIAAGGMAEIFLAKQVGLDGFEKLVVVKRILPEFAKEKEYVRMFLDEAKTAADLRHANIVSTFEIDEDKGVYFMVMEYLHGLDLRFIFRKLSSHKQSLPLQLAIAIVMEACSGLSYAHKKNDLKGRSLGIVHRDISPQNLVVTFEGEIKVVDFGIAQAAHLEQEAKNGVLKGKYAYMSPEQANGLELDHRTDQFALGIVLYELTTMHRLFRRAHQDEALAAVAMCEVAPPSTLHPDYPPALQAIVMKALSKERNDRYADCNELRRALADFLHQAGESFSKDRLSTYMHSHFQDYEERQLDFAASGIDPEHLHATYLRPQTQSSLGGHSRPYFALVAFATVVVATCVAAAALFLSEKKQAAVSTMVAAKPLPATLEPLPQTMGVPEPQKAPAIAAPVKRMGRLKIVVEPWGEVFVDGKRIGLTPLAARKISEGLHTVRVVNSRLGQEKTLSIVVQADKDTLVRHQF